MKKFIAAIALAGLSIGPALAQPSVGISIGINQPGVYGRIDIGDAPRPALVVSQPMIITPAPYVVERRPIYLYVPPTHQRDWRHYCSRYGACGQPVYFVRDEWVRERYAQAHPGWDRGRHRGGDKHRGDDHRGWDKHRHDDDRGPKHGRGRD